MTRPLCAGLLAMVALALAIVPWLRPPDAWLQPVDSAAALLPAAPVLALSALALAGRSVTALPALAALTLSAWALVGEEPASAPAAPRGPHLVVVSQNVWVNNVDPAATIEALNATGADVLLLQEVDGTVAPFLNDLRARYPFGSRCKPRCSAAIFSRWPIERPRYRFRDEQGREVGPGLVQTRIRVPGAPDPVPVVSIHLSRRGRATQLAADIAGLSAALAGVPSPASIVAGDLNLSGWSPGMHRLESALAPLTRATRGDFTYPARLFGQRWPVPLVAIDHLFAGPGWQTVQTQTLPAAGSDHRAIHVELVWQP